MDKNKNRTDLLAAGRKKLQQYRQKKDTKGTSSHGKSSKKSGKSEKHEGDDATASSVDKATKISLVADGEMIPSTDHDPGIADSSLSHSIANPEACEVNVASLNPLPVATIPEMHVSEAVLPLANEPEPKELAVGEDNTGFIPSRDSECSQAVDVERVPSLEASDKQEGEITHVHMPISVHLPSLPTPDEDMEGATAMAETNTVNTEKESFLPREDIPDMSLIQAREDQEAEGSGFKQYGSSEIADERDGACHFPELTDSRETPAEAALGRIAVEQATHEGNQIMEVDDDQPSGGTTNITDGLSASSLAVPEADGDLNSEVRKQQSGDIATGLSIEEKPKVQVVSGYYETNRKDDVQGDAEHEAIANMHNQHPLPDRSSIFEGKNNESPFEPEVTDSSGATIDYPVSGVCSISMSQIVHVIRGLGEDEFQLLLKSRESDANLEFGNGSLVIPDHAVLGFLGKLKEELFLTNISKDILQLQLTEQSEMQMEVDEISALSDSLNDVRGKNDSLGEELAQCKSELQVVAGGREELQNQLLASNKEAQEISSRAQQLQISLERSQEDLSILSKELADCKSLVDTLQAENDNLSSSLASVTENTRTLEEQKEYFLHENEKLLTELAEYKNLVAAVQAENCSLSNSVASVTDERNKLGEEKVYIVQEKEKVSKELADLKGFLDALQVEVASVNESLAVVTEERKKLEEDKLYFLHENEKLTSELLVMQGQLSTEHQNLVQVDADLKQATMRLEQLAEENSSLTSNLDMHAAKIREIDDRQIKVPIEAEEERNQFDLAEVTGRHTEIATHGEDVPQSSGKQDGLVPSPVLENPLLDGLGGERPVGLLQEVDDDSIGFVFLKSRLKEAEKTLQNLEKQIEEMHSHSSALSKQGSKMSKPAVSKLIQAFESKVNQEDIEVVTAATADLSSTNVYLLTREQTGNMRALLKQLMLDAENASLQLRQEQDGKEAANIMLRELKIQHESLKEHCDNLESANVELDVLNEAVKQYLCDVEAKNKKLEVICESLRQQDTSLEAENSELSKTLTEYQSKLVRLENQFHELQQSSDEVASTIQNQLESVQNEAVERETLLEQKWSHVVAHIVETVGKLGITVETFPDFTVGTQDELDTNSLVSASVDAAVKVIGDLQEKLKAVHIDYEAMSNSYKEVIEKHNGLCSENELATGVLRKIHGDLWKLLNDSCGFEEKTNVKLKNLELLDLLDPTHYESLIQQLGNLLQERLQLESLNNKLNAELVSATKDIEELNRRCLDSTIIDKLIGDAEAVVKLKDSQAGDGKPPIYHLESLVSFLVEKYKEADEKVCSSREQCASQVMEMSELQEMIHQLNTLNLQHENEILILKESLSQAEEAVLSTNSQLQEKASELEQSEQRVSSYREKLGIAVAKGKGLVVQRDSLKQSLAEKSIELERCSQELQLKEARLLEVESELKTYLEAGERVEALESELSYIRNSATALRESFLHKDSVLQRIEEILEDLDLPEHFHSRDIIEKVDWLARSAAANSVPVTEWDQKSSGGGDSYLDSGFVVMDAWKEDVPPNLNAGDDLRRKHEELQSKFYGLAEQNEMLEQSLMERNNLVQRWEELLDKINMPSHLRSLEPEDRIEWLGSALSEALNERSFLQQKTNELETYCSSLTADLEESRNKLSELGADLQRVVTERDHLSERLEILTHSHDSHSSKAVQLELVNEKLQNEVTILQETVAQKLEKEESAKNIESEIRRMQELVCDALKDHGITDLVSGGSSTGCLEASLTKLLENYSVFSEVKPVPELADSYSGKDAEGQGIRVIEAENLKQELEAILHELMHVKDERDIYLEKQQSLGYEVEALNRKMKDLQELLNQEEQKSAVAREKLNVAVRKGKSLVQQRDSLKQTIEAMNTEVERLKSEINRRGNVLVEYEEKIRDLSTYQERVEALESESLFLKNCLKETEYYLQEKGGTLSTILDTLGDVDFGGEVNMNDPVKKLEQIINICRDLHESAASSEQQSQKSKRAAELLLAELNEVQERNDGLQEDLAKASTELVALSNERDVAEAARAEAVLRFEKLSALHSQEGQHLMVLKSGIEKFRKGFFEFKAVLDDIFYRDLELLRYLEAGLESCLNLTDAINMASLPALSVESFISNNTEDKNPVADIGLQEYFEDNVVTEVCSFVQHHLREFVTDFGCLKETIKRHSMSLQDQTSKLYKILGTVHTEMATQRKSFEAMKRDIIGMELAGKEKEKENIELHKNIATLFEACSGLVTEVENRKAELVRSNAGDMGLNLDSINISDGGLPSSQQYLFSEECIKTLADRLLSAVKDFANIHSDMIDGSLREMKVTVSKLQKEIQEKDIQKDRISMELVGQIKVAEASAAGFLLELKSSKAELNNLEKQVKEMEEERNSLHRRMKELQDEQVSSAELQERLTSLTNALAAKDQEIDALMQALDVEEGQMDDMRKKIDELERVLQQKNLDLENLEASRGKLVKKHSITVSKFDELHYLSANLISEVEKLQSQIQDRDAEISFLRQEVTRCTNDALVASQLSNNKKSDEIHGLLTWFNTVVSGIGVHDVHRDDKSSDHDYKEILQEKIMSVISELKDLQVEAHTRGTLLQGERSQIEELTRKHEALEKSLQEKESQLNLLQGSGDSGRASTATSEILEVESMMNKRAIQGSSVAPQVRSLRKVNNDQVAIAVDMDPGSDSRVEDEDDDKVHGFKSLTTSRIIPRFTRPVADMIDGVWVSCDRTLMRQPTFRLGIILYWVVMHALLATFVV